MLLHFKMSRKGRQNTLPSAPREAMKNFPSWFRRLLSRAVPLTSRIAVPRPCGAARFSTTSFQDIFLPVSGEGNRWREGHWSQSLLQRSNAAFWQSTSKHKFQSKLEDPWISCLEDFSKSIAGWIWGKVGKLAIYRLGYKINVIKDIEELGPKLHWGVLIDPGVF